MGFLTRGRILKAGTVQRSTVAVSWDAPKRKEGQPEGEIEVVREGGQVARVMVHCCCGRTHELELIPSGASSEKGTPS